MSRLLNREKANRLLDEIDEVADREAIRVLLATFEEEFSDHPESLISPLDLAFLAEVATDRVSLVRDIFCGRADPGLGWLSADEQAGEIEMSEVREDVNFSGLRPVQAHNFIVTSADDKLEESALLIFMNGVLSQQVPGSRSIRRDQVMDVRKPDAPIDYLFMVKALHKVLSTEGLVRKLIVST